MSPLYSLEPAAQHLVATGANAFARGVGSSLAPTESGGGGTWDGDVGLRTNNLACPQQEQATDGRPVGLDDTGRIASRAGDGRWGMTNWSIPPVPQGLPPGASSGLTGSRVPSADSGRGPVQGLQQSRGVGEARYPSLGVASSMGYVASDGTAGSDRWGVFGTPGTRSDQEALEIPSRPLSPLITPLASPDQAYAAGLLVPPQLSRDSAQGPNPGSLSPTTPALHVQDPSVYPSLASPNGPHRNRAGSGSASSVPTGSGRGGLLSVEALITHQGEGDAAAAAAETANLLREGRDSPASLEGQGVMERLREEGWFSDGDFPGVEVRAGAHKTGGEGETRASPTW